jgi:hypothetical protein
MAREESVCLNNALQFHTHYVPCTVTPRQKERLPKAKSVILVHVFTKVIYEPCKNNSPSIITANTETRPHNGTAALCGIFNDTESFSCWVYIVLNAGFMDEMQRTRK